MERDDDDDDEDGNDEDGNEEDGDEDGEDGDGHLEGVADEAKDGEDLDRTPKAAPVFLLWGGALGKGVIYRQADKTESPKVLFTGASDGC